MPFRFPTLSDRVTINGRTGSGKSVAGAWLLSEADFHKQPFIIVDMKREKLFAAVERIIPIDLTDKLPTAPGVYILRPFPHETEEMKQWLWKVWHQTHVGLFFDEGYLIPDSDIFRTLLTTGRSLQIPVYTLSQRPLHLPRYVFTEADFYMAFHLNDKRDRDVVRGFTPENADWDTTRRLKPFHSRWYDISQDFTAIMRPVPSPDQIINRFDMRLTPRRKFI